MPLIVNGADGGTSGTTVTAGPGNSGGVSGTAFDTLVISATCTLTFDNAHAAHGGLGYKFQLGGTAGEDYVQWLASFSPVDVNPVWVRAYCYFTANPGATIYLCRIAQAAGTSVAGLALDTAGKLLIKDGAGTIQATSAAAIPLNNWFRFEAKVFGSATVGQVTLLRFDTADAVAPSETLVTAATLNTAGAMSRIRFGHTGTGVATVGPWWMDDLAVTTNDWIGPVGGGTQPQRYFAPRRRPTFQRLRFRQLVSPPVVVTGDVNITPATVAAVASIDAPAVSAGASLTAVTVAGVATVGAPTVSAGATVAATTVAAVAAVGSPTESAGASVTPVTVAAVATVGAPVVGISYTVTPATVQAIATVGSPVVSAGGSVNITPATVAAVATVGAPVVSAGASLTATTVQAVATVGVAVPHAGATVAPATVAGVTTVGAPAVSAGANVAPATVAGVATVGVPVVSAGGSVNVSPATVAAVVTVGTPVPHAGASVTPATVAGTVTIGGPVVAVHVTITPATVAVVTTIGAPVVRAGATVIAVTVAGVVTIGAPVVLTTEPPKPGPVVGYRPAVPSATGYRFLAPETVTSPVLTSAAALATTAAAHADRYPAAAPSMVGV
jgi:hypothetical protein